METYFEYQPAYNNFISKLAPKNLTISLPTVMEFKEEQHRVSKILGICAHKKISLKILDIFSRSIKFKLVWDKNKTDELLVFCPVSKSPEEFLRELKHKATCKVASTYTDEELKDLDKQAKKEFKDSIKKAKLKGNIKIEKL